MKNILLITFLLISTFTNAQKAPKVFTDTFEDGKLTYSYYIDNETSEMVKHGNFKYEKKLTSERTNGTLTNLITGNFKDGLRDGTFQYNIKTKDYPNYVGTYTTKITSATLTYSNGLPNGIWKVSSSWRTRDYNYRLEKYTWSKYSDYSTEYAETNFKNGIATGKTKFKNAEDKEGVSFTLSPEGFMVGKYLFKDTYDIFDLEFNSQGILVKTIIRDKSGNVESKNFANVEMVEIANQYMRKKITNKDLLSQKIKIDTVNNGLSFLDYNYIFEKDIFLFREIGGDKTISEYSSRLDRVYKRFFEVKKSY
ncbi:hypothetical protein [Ulvibacter litoralis]|uniref:MORN repeat variant n=1 Tax=Ulvibacter litoralis TaxID=227084 RepID=A0A1G7HFT4_9FLAO|nr:hypothetical protein [Ulvibacter litoralis]GHC57659.1 hypothetical protein GCM10008083_22810 [Ulvibacter litoralis]SDE99231.1 hypothetical protein SAMN05421855_10467 [Ulvibacter litoralis]